MLPAKSQETPPTTAPIEQTSLPVGGFGKVLNSIHGLQQRLDDFSVEEVIRAGAKAETLIRQLSSIQVKLSGIPLLKQVFREADRIISEIPEENFDLLALNNLEKYPTFNALLTTANQLQQAVLACPEKPANLEPPALKALPSPVSQAEPLSIISDGAPAPAEPTQVREELTAGGADDLQASEPASEQINDAPVAGTLSDQANDALGGKKAPARGSSDFDQSLLDDLIKSYGDFASLSSRPAAPQKSSKPSPAAPAKAKSTAVPAPIRQPSTMESQSRNAAPVGVAKIKSALPPKAAPADIIPLLEARPSEAIEENVPSLTRHGELDRQLKSIIKDYGEYDLYPRRNSLNVKIAGIVAFALLGLVLAGFYLFKTPAPVTTAPANSTVQPEAKISSGASSGTANRSPGPATKNAKEKN